MIYYPVQVVLGVFDTKVFFDEFTVGEEAVNIEIEDREVDQRLSFPPRLAKSVEPLELNYEHWR